jgi:trk system potassium uptake protein TrkA
MNNYMIPLKLNLQEGEGRMKVAIVGAGKLGLKITEALLGGDNAVTLIDKNADLMQKIGSQMDLLTVTSNAKQIEILQELDIKSYDYLVAVTDTDEKNIVICSFAKKLGCPKVIARIRDPEHMNQINFIMEAMGIDYIVNPDMAIANEIFKYLVEQYSLSNGYFSSGRVGLIEFTSDKLPIIIDKPIKEIVKMLENMLVLAISRKGKIIIPHKNTLVLEDDFLYVIGETEPILKLNAIVRENEAVNALHKVMIVGGGKTGLYLAQKLSEASVSVKLIEIDKARCQYLSEHLNDVLVLHGDATDMNLLEEENIDEMDAFVTATGYDEDNLLLALMAKQHHVVEVVAKVSRTSYAELIEKLGIDMALNPLDITASSILRFIQGSKRVISSQFIQGQAEIMEIVAAKGIQLLDIPIARLLLPDGVMIAAIQRNDEIIIPNGSTQIKENDKVTIFCLLTDVPKLEKLLRSTKTSFFR